MDIKKIEFAEEFYSLNHTKEEMHRKTIIHEFYFGFDQSNELYRKLLGQLASGYLNEGDVSKFMTRIVRQGDIVVDVGANVGFYTMLLSCQVGSSGAVYAFDASDLNIQAIHRNIELNNFKNITAKHALLSDYDNELVHFHYDTFDSGTSYALKEKADTLTSNWQSLPSITLNRALANVKKIKLIKIDVEGFEVAVLKGASDLLKNKRVRYWIVEYAVQCLNRNGESLDSLRSYMAQFGLEMFVLDYEGGFPKYYPPNVFIGGRWLSNLLFANPLDLGTDWVVDNTTTLSGPKGNLFDITLK